MGNHSVYTFHHRNCSWLQIAHESTCKCLRIGERLPAGSSLPYYKYFTSLVSARLLLDSASECPALRKTFLKHFQEVTAGLSTGIPASGPPLVNPLPALSTSPSKRVFQLTLPTLTFLRLCFGHVSLVWKTLQPRAAW